MALAGQTPLTLYPLNGCTFGTKDAKGEKLASTKQRMARLEEKYKQQGLRRTVEGVLLVHQHGHPHLLLLQTASQSIRLPGGKLRPGEDEVEGLKRKLANVLSPAAASLAIDWQIGECIATYWRPHFEPHMYPYLPVHITRPKETRKLYIVHLPERCYFAVPKDLKLVAIPLYDCYEGHAKFGSVVAALPHLISRYRVTIVAEDKS